MTVRCVAPAAGDAETAWDAFAAGVGAPIYATSAWLDFLGRVAPGVCHRWVAYRGDTITGTLAAVVTRDPCGAIVNALPWYGTPGACVLADPADDATRRALLGALAGLAEAEDALTCALVLTPEEETAAAGLYEDILRPTTTDPRIGQVTVLPDRAAPALDDVLSLCSQKTRNLVRKAFKQGFTAERADDDAAWAALVRLHTETMRAKGAAPKPPEHFAALREALPPERRTLWLARAGDAVAAALLLVHHGRQTDYLVPAADVVYRDRQPLSLLIAHGMMEAMAAGRPQWNWGGTWLSQTTLHHFKAGFGAEDRPYRYLIRGRADARAVLSRDLPRLRAAHPYHYLWPLAELST